MLTTALSRDNEMTTESGHFYTIPATFSYLAVQNQSKFELV